MMVNHSQRKLTTIFAGPEVHASVVQFCMIQFLAAELQIAVPETVFKQYALRSQESLQLMPVHLLVQVAANQ